MARGFDLIAAQAVCELKEVYPNIKLVACIPCPSQDGKFTAEEKEKYQYVLSKCDSKILLSDHYFNGCMLMRNRFLVDNSSMLIAYLRQKRGGTFYTVKYAEEKGKKIYNKKSKLRCVVARSEATWQS